MRCQNRHGPCPKILLILGDQECGIGEPYWSVIALCNVNLGEARLVRVDVDSAIL